jgi:hypothetical protein
LYSGVTGAAATNTGLKYRVIQRLVSGQEVDVDPATTFRSGDRVRFAFESNTDGYLYVAQQGSSGRWTVLFPNPEANGGTNTVGRFAPYYVPDNGWFTFDETPGREEVFVLLSREPLAELPGFKAPLTRPETLPGTVVAGLKQIIQPRDLIFQKDVPASGRLGQATYVVNREELAPHVAASLTLAHEP